MKEFLITLWNNRTSEFKSKFLKGNKNFNSHVQGKNFSKTNSLNENIAHVPNKKYEHVGNETNWNAKRISGGKIAAFLYEFEYESLNNAQKPSPNRIV